MITLQKLREDLRVPTQDIDTTHNTLKVNRQIPSLKNRSFINQDLVSKSRRSIERRTVLIVMLFFMIFSVFHVDYLSAQHIGLQVEWGKPVLFGDSISGSGTKFIWDVTRGAIRAGEIESPLDTLWDGPNLGGNSVAFGYNNLASGHGSMSWGHNNEARSSMATSFGHDNIASGVRATAWGFRDTASNQLTTVWGTGNHASNIESTAWGNGNKASGATSTVWGVDNESSTNGTTVWGIHNKAIGQFATSWGYENLAVGFYSTAWGRSTKAIGDHSTSWGLSNEAMGEYSTSWGTSNKATGIRSTALGEANVSDGQRSMVWGYNNLSNLENTTAWGKENVAEGLNSTVWGGNNKSQSIYETVIGRYADTVAFADKFLWGSFDQLFAIGNGSDNTSRHNAFTVYKNGVTVLSPEDVGQDIIIEKFTNGSFNEPIIRPNSADWGYLGDESNYFTKTYSNNFFAGATANYQTFSDSRLKSNITDLDDGLSIIQALHPVNYELKKGNHKIADDLRHYGLVAQEVEKVLPDIVHTHPSGMKSVGYQALIPFLIKGMQEQQKVINELEKKNSQYESKLDRYQSSHEELINKIQQLERQIDRINTVINK